MSTLADEPRSVSLMTSSKVEHDVRRRTCVGWKDEGLDGARQKTEHDVRSRTSPQNVEPPTEEPPTRLYLETPSAPPECTCHGWEDVRLVTMASGGDTRWGGVGGAGSYLEDRDARADRHVQELVRRAIDCDVVVGQVAVRGGRSERRAGRRIATMHRYPARPTKFLVYEICQA